MGLEQVQVNTVSQHSPEHSSHRQIKLIMLSFCICSKRAIKLLHNRQFSIYWLVEQRFELHAED